MRVTIPPGQSLPDVLASVSITPTEARALRDALELVQTRGSSQWHVNVAWADIEASITLMLDLEAPLTT